MKVGLLAFATIAAIAISVTNASAVVTLGNYNESQSDPTATQVVDMFPAGVVDGITVGEASNEARGFPPVICTSSNLILTQDEDVVILQTYVSDDNPVPQTPLAAIPIKHPPARLARRS